MTWWTEFSLQIWCVAQLQIGNFAISIQTTNMHVYMCECMGLVCICSRRNCMRRNTENHFVVVVIAEISNSQKKRSTHLMMSLILSKLLKLWQCNRIAFEQHTFVLNAFLMECWNLKTQYSSDSQYYGNEKGEKVKIRCFILGTIVTDFRISTSVHCEQLNFKRSRKSTSKKFGFLVRT